MKLGMTLSSEEHGPRQLVRLAQLAEDAGFDFVSISDHFHPWLDDQGHSAFVWSVLGAIAERTDRITVAVGVTCPTVRIHPAILAQATATTAHLLGERFVWGVGSGEALNEHILGDRWPPADLRLEMLEEAVEVVRKLWEGHEVTHRGRHYTVENARIYDAPPFDIPIIVSAFGTAAAEVAGRCGDGLWTGGTSTDVIEAWRAAGGEGPIYSQVNLSWAADVDEARKTAHTYWRQTGAAGQLHQDLTVPALFEQATAHLRAEDMDEFLPCGPDPEPVLEKVAQARESGVDHLYFHQVGPDQEGFLRFWTDELAPRLR